MVWGSAGKQGSGESWAEPDLDLPGGLDGMGSAGEQGSGESRDGEGGRGGFTVNLVSSESISTLKHSARCLSHLTNSKTRTPIFVCRGPRPELQLPLPARSRPSAESRPFATPLRNVPNCRLHHSQSHLPPACDTTATTASPRLLGLPISRTSGRWRRQKCDKY